MRINLIIKQPNNSAEARAASFFAMTSNNIYLESVNFSKIDEFRNELSSGLCMPIGSVEYVRKAMGLAGIKEPENQSYPDCLKDLFHRKIEIKKASETSNKKFIKPLKTKLFNGFVLNLEHPNDLNEHDREQQDIFTRIDQNELIWMVDAVNFLSEWRFYVDGGRITGVSRYDQLGTDDAPAPDMEKVSMMIGLLEQDAAFDLTAYALDVGVLSTGETAVVEVNDAWALGLYSSGMDRKEYIEMLIHRWHQLKKTIATPPSETLR